MAKDKKRYLVMVSYSMEIEGTDQTDASVNAAFKVKYGTDDAKALTVRVVRELHQASQEKALTEAPFADQVTVNEEAPAPNGPRTNLLRPWETPAPRETPNRPLVADTLRDVLAQPAPVPVTADDGIPF